MDDMHQVGDSDGDERAERMPSMDQDATTSTPSPSASATANPNTHSLSRRAPRKSSQTQQQKNQKRQRATQDQLVTLEVEFNKNPTPTATVRERIAEEINMTERSVQIWFQNRRAKLKLMAKKSIETGEDVDNIPESMRQYLAMQAMESGQPFGANYLGRGPYGPYGGMMIGGEPGPQGKVVITHLSCRSLRIGSWKRIGQNAMDLIIFYSSEKACMTYYINNDQSGYKIEYPFSRIKNIYLDNGDGELMSAGGLVIELNGPPLFSMDSIPGTSGFGQCGDFTEGHQATQIMVHHLEGNPKVLAGQLAKLCSLDSFMHRHMPYDPPHFSISAPASPGMHIHRPSSQPNYNAQAHVGMFQEQWGIGVNPAARGPGHKRQRSRSVPMAVDFSMFNTPMPSFVIQHPGETTTLQHNPAIFAPVPQQPMGSNLRIETLPAYGMDYRQYPMSAAATSPSEFGSSFSYSQGPESGPLPPSTYSTPYSAPFLSPMVDSSSMIQSSVSALSFVSPVGDPAIVGQSPPVSMLHRSTSADPFAAGYTTIDGMPVAIMEDDQKQLAEMYSKHSLSLPMHNHTSSPSPMGHSQHYAPSTQSHSPSPATGHVTLGYMDERYSHSNGHGGISDGYTMHGEPSPGSVHHYYDPNSMKSEASPGSIHHYYEASDMSAQDLDMNSLVHFDHADHASLSPEEGVISC